MLDVHPPHAATHTWRDFFIHVATICVGLLIAIGLEQSVEAIHNSHIRQELRESLHSDSERVILDAKNLDLQATANMHYIKLLDEQAEASLQGRKLPEPPGPAYVRTDVPIFPAWQAAKAGGEIAVLPPSDIKAFSEAEETVGQTDTDITLVSAAFAKITDFTWSHAGIDHSNMDFDALSAEQKQQYIQLLVQGYETLLELRVDDRKMLGALESIDAGERNLDQIKKAENPFNGKP